MKAGPLPQPNRRAARIVSQKFRVNYRQVIAVVAVGFTKNKRLTTPLAFACVMNDDAEPLFVTSKVDRTKYKLSVI